jgi:hypothetical protein
MLTTDLLRYRDRWHSYHHSPPTYLRGEMVGTEGDSDGIEG